MTPPEALLLDMDQRWRGEGKPRIRIRVLGSMSLMLQTDYERGTKVHAILRLRWAICGLLVFISPAILHAQFGSALEVTFKALPTGDDWFPMKGFQWETEAGIWVAEFEETPLNAKSKRTRPSIRITDPSGHVGMAAEDPRAHGVIWEEMTGSFSEPPKWSEPWICAGPGTGREVFLGEQTTLGNWRVFRILWHVGGLSGPPPMPFVLVVAHQKTGQWMAFASALEYPPTPARGDIMSVAGDGESLSVSWWYAFSPNVYQLKGWHFTSGANGISCSDFPRAYSLFTNNGSVASLGRTPAEAIRKGYLEVVWSLKQWNEIGGVAVASELSPRKLLSDDDAFEAPILPEPGSRKFVWAKDMFVVPWKGKPKHMPLKEALSVLKSSQWGVVLFPLAKGPALAGRLVEYPFGLPRPIASRPLPSH